MTIDYKEKYFALKDKEDEQLKNDVGELKEMVATHNSKHEGDIVRIDNKLKEIVKQTTATNGKVIDHARRLTTIEKIIGRKINFNDPTLLKTARVALITTAIVVIVIFTGGKGLEPILKWLTGI